jgi:rhodanese-related sulfurtransferase
MGILRRVAKRILKGSSTPPSPASSSAVKPADGVSLASLDCDAQELKERLGAGEDIVVVDVRTPQELGRGGIPGAVNIPLDEMERRWQEVKDANEIVCYCQAGARSLKAVKILRSRGVFNATSLEGGILAWTAIGGDVGQLGTS